MNLVGADVPREPAGTEFFVDVGVEDEGEKRSAILSVIVRGIVQEVEVLAPRGEILEDHPAIALRGGAGQSKVGHVKVEE